jgi:hypothetical protein
MMARLKGRKRDEITGVGWPSARVRKRRTKYFQHHKPWRVIFLTTPRLMYQGRSLALKSLNVACTHRSVKADSDTLGMEDCYLFLKGAGWYSVKSHRKLQFQVYFAINVQTNTDGASSRCH